MHLEQETQQAIDKAVRDVFRKAAAYEEIYAVIEHWLYERGIRMAYVNGRWHLEYTDKSRTGLYIPDKFITFAQAFERAIREIERD